MNIRRPYFSIYGEVIDIDFPDATPVIKAVTDSIYKLCEPWSFSVTIRSDAGTVKRYTFTIHEGYRFDGASIPRLFWRIVGHPFMGSFICPALAHDYMYSGEFFRREICDNAFSLGLQKMHVFWLKRTAMYYAVRLGGGYVWDKHTESTIKESRQTDPKVEIIIK